MLALFCIALILPAALSRPENGVPTSPASRDGFCPECSRCGLRPPPDLILIQNEDIPRGIVQTLPLTTADIIRNILLQPRIGSRDAGAEKAEENPKVQARGGWGPLLGPPINPRIHLWD
ncbi:unnamed protein product [Colias eurytheme]|nr:unnamed protein product [Colias eurytheme]